MSPFNPDGARKRRRLAGFVLAVGGAAVIATASKDYPREQPIVFRLPDAKRATLVASFTKVGEAEARSGFTLELPDRAFRDVSHTIRVPNGDYIVTLDLRRRPNAQQNTGVGAGAPTLKTDAGAPTLKTDAGAPTLTNRAPTLTTDGDESPETSVSKRVSLSGNEVIVPVPARSE